MADPRGRLRRLWSAWRLRWKRRQLLWRAIRSGRDLTPLADRTAQIRKGDILAFVCLRNEIRRLPEFLAHYRALGVSHFLIVDNGSDDGSDLLLLDQGDVSLWHTRAAYRQARFGMDWLGALLFRHGHGHWCVTVDADELLIWPEHESRPLPLLTAQLDAQGVRGMGALMLDLFPQGRLARALPGTILQQLPFFDPGPYRCRIAQPRRNRQVQGGIRERVFFADRPERSPTLNKLPLIRWSRRYVYVNSTHSMLPPRMNDLWDGPGDPRLSGVLLHSKFLPDIGPRSAEELHRRQHFADPDAYRGYHQALIRDPVLWHCGAQRFRDWRQMVELGLMGRGSAQ